MYSKKISMFSFGILVSVIGFLLHFTWEYLQCSPLYVHLKVSPTSWSMISAALGDVLILWLAYFIVAVFRKTFSTPWDLSCRTNLILLVLISAVISEFIEYYSVNQLRWTYSSLNPTINGISVVPIFQMALINPLAIFLTRKFLMRNDLN